MREGEGTGDGEGEGSRMCIVGLLLRTIKRKGKTRDDGGSGGDRENQLGGTERVSRWCMKKRRSQMVQGLN